MTLDLRMKARNKEMGEKKAPGLLSEESKSVLQKFGSKFQLPDALQYIAYLDLLFSYYKSDKLRIDYLLETFDYLSEKQKGGRWLSDVGASVFLNCF